MSHDGKKALEVKVGPSIYGVDYSWFFDQMSKEIAKNINVPEYVDAMESDFSSSTQVHRIVSKIVLMKSMKEYFEYKMMFMCGIPAIEMKGTKEDWENLNNKIKELRKILQPIANAIELQLDWFDKIETISKKLLDTYNGNPDKDWWSRIITGQPFGSGGQSTLEGWFMGDLLNIHDATEISDAPSGLVSVPMTISDGINEEKSAVVAGMVGYKFHESEANRKPSAWLASKIYAVEPIHGWSLLLKPNSVFRMDMLDWEERIHG